MTYTITGKPIEDYLEKNGLEKKAFMLKFDLNPTTYGKIMRGEKVSLTKIFILAHKMNLSINDFLA